MGHNQNRSGRVNKEDFGRVTAPEMVQWLKQFHPGHVPADILEGGDGDAGGAGVKERLAEIVRERNDG